MVVLPAEVNMSTLTITLSDERLAQLQEIAARFRVKPEDLARISIEELLTRPEAAFQHAVEYILHKNQELYRRLA
jgi:predicted transcriptional regulator